ncbi:MAG: hypothetical protein JNL95_03870 [Chitinophagales bacterium]|nr:hypothetical protein [Chitinophagales bacterium]
MAILNHEEQLQKIFLNVNEWLKFAEAKNFGLLTLNSAIVFGFSQTNFDADSIVKIVGFYVFAPFAFLSSFLSIISLFPILTTIEKGVKLKGILAKISAMIDKETLVENIHFYGYLRTLEKNEFISKFQSKTNSSTTFTIFEEELVVQILYNSRITWLKYQFFKIAGFIALVGILLSPFALLILKLVK